MDGFSTPLARGEGAAQPVNANGDRLKLALVSPYDFAYPGGVTEHVSHLSAELRRRGHEVHIIAPSSDDEGERGEAAADQIHRIGRVVQLPANGSMARITLSLRSYLQAKALLREEQFDLIHLHEPMMPALPLTVLRHSQSINVGTFHAFNTMGLNYFYAKPILQPFFKKLHGRIAVSSAARDFVDQYFQNDYRVIPNGIDYLRFNTPREPLPELQDGRPNVLFVGRLEKRKGLSFLLRAWRQVLGEVPNARLVVVGRGRTLEGYRKFARAQGWSDDDVRFAGYVSDEDLPRYYQSAAVYCAPNTGQESFGVVLLEAMAAGAPIVASDIPGYRSVVDHGHEGLLVEPKKPALLAHAISQLLQSPELRARMGDAGRAKAGYFDWLRVSEQVLAFYREVIERQQNAEQPAPRFARMRRMAGLLS
jgi:phosphatidylinositol alpha-mannosyltransferase